MDLHHAHRLKTSMEYLRESMSFEESRRRQEFVGGPFAYQAEEVNRTSRHIEAIHQKLTRVKATRSTTVLVCDWNDVNQTRFSEADGASKRGCHELIEYGARRRGSRSGAWGAASFASPPHYVNLGETEHFGCFDADGLPQGCHAYVTKKIERIIFRVGCASGDPRNWGWCGQYPCKIVMLSRFVPSISLTLKASLCREPAA